jgi:hypothetical protein
MVLVPATDSSHYSGIQRLTGSPPALGPGPTGNFKLKSESSGSLGESGGPTSSWQAASDAARARRHPAAAAGVTGVAESASRRCSD